MTKFRRGKKLRRGKIQDHSDERYLAALAAAEDREAWKARAEKAEEELLTTREFHEAYINAHGRALKAEAALREIVKIWDTNVGDYIDIGKIVAIARAALEGKS